jgi:predicted HAD superfamily Cof-like phosphohydrolase
LTNSYFEDVHKFHEVFGQEIDAEATFKLLEFRFKLLDEEMQEVAEEFAALANARTDSEKRKVKAKLTKELVDLVYVALGAAVSLGLPFEEAFNEVQRSNMSKLEDGKPLKREDGKVLKGKDYSEANIEQFF